MQMKTMVPGHRTAFVLYLAVLIGLLACSDPLPSDKEFACPCVQGFECVDEVCVAVPPEDVVVAPEDVTADLLDAAIEIEVAPVDLASVDLGTADASSSSICVAVGGKACVEPTAILFNCPVSCVTTAVAVENHSSTSVTVNMLSLGTPTAEFVIMNAPAMPFDIGVQGVDPLLFEVRYCPSDEDFEDENVLRVFTDSDALPGGVLEIPLEVHSSPALLEISTDSETAFLDFEQGDTHVIQFYNKTAQECAGICPKEPCCGCPAAFQSFSIDPPDAQDWYTVSFTKTPGGEVPLPHVLQGGDTMQMEVSYTLPTGVYVDKNATICVAYLAPPGGLQSYCTKAISVSQCDFSLAPVNQMLQFNAASPSDVKEKPVVLINDGGSPCQIKHVKVTDKWNGVSEDFSLKEVFPSDTQIPPFSLLPVWVQYSPHSSTLSGYVSVEYVDSVVGNVIETVALAGSKEQNCAQPVASIAQPDPAPKAGESMLLDGCASTAGECGGPVYEGGYMWFLITKPAGSAAMLNAEGSCSQAFVPDMPGQYTVALIVFDQVEFIQSELATVALEVIP